MAEFEDLEKTLSRMSASHQEQAKDKSLADTHNADAHAHASLGADSKTHGTHAAPGQDNVQAVYANPHAEEDQEAASAAPTAVAASHHDEKALERDLEKADISDKHIEAAGQEGSVPAGAGEKQDKLNPFVVDWDGPDDPENPRNWTTKKKISNIGIVSAITFLTPLASSMFAPAIPEVLEEFQIRSSFLGSFVVSVYLLGFAVGPMILAPISETYGRRWVYVICNFLFVGFTIACGKSTSMGMLIAFRFLAGCAGSAPLTIGGGSIADMVIPEQRGKYMSIFAMGPIVGPVIGPIAGGYLAEAKGFRWIFYLISILSAVTSILSLCLLRETYPPVLLEQKAKKLNRENNTDKYLSIHHNPLPMSEIFLRAIVRPIKMLMSPIILFLSIFMAVIYGYLYLLFTTFYIVFQGRYHFSTGSVGLSFVGIGIGSVIGLVIVGVASDKLLKHLTAKNGGVQKPEFRLPPMVYGSVSIPIGLFMYGWTAEKHVHWIAPLIGTFFVGLGLMVIFMPVSTYLIDAYTQYAASALAANTILRSIVGCFLPLAGDSLYRNLGVGWGNSLLGFLAVAMIPIPIIFNRYGERIRMKYKFDFD